MKDSATNVKDSATNVKDSATNPTADFDATNCRNVYCPYVWMQT